MEEVNIFRFVLSFVFVVGLIGLFGVALRKYGARLNLAGGGKPGGRLKVVETCYLGPRHRLLLVQRDAVEHLLLIGPDAQAVVESGIGKEKA